MATEWKSVSPDASVFEGRDRNVRAEVSGNRFDLVFGSNFVLRALAEVYASADGEENLVHEFGAVWNKVKNIDRFDLATA